MLQVCHGSLLIKHFHKNVFVGIGVIASEKTNDRIRMEETEGDSAHKLSDDYSYCYCCTRNFLPDFSQPTKDIRYEGDVNGWGGGEADTSACQDNIMRGKWNLERKSEFKTFELKLILTSVYCVVNLSPFPRCVPLWRLLSIASVQRTHRPICTLAFSTRNFP